MPKVKFKKTIKKSGSKVRTKLSDANALDLPKGMTKPKKRRIKNA
jgi:hypothetical protein